MVAPVAPATYAPPSTLTSALLVAVTKTGTVIPEIVTSSLSTAVLIGAPSTSAIVNEFGMLSGGGPDNIPVK